MIPIKYSKYITFTKHVRYTGLSAVRRFVTRDFSGLSKYRNTNNFSRYRNSGISLSNTCRQVRWIHNESGDNNKENNKSNIGIKLTRIVNKIRDFFLRIKWILIRSKRPFNLEDISAFISWLLTGNIMFLIIGTTTFFSLVLVTFNKITDKETVAKWLGNNITKNSNLYVNFENAILPDWKSGTIQLKNCKASKRPKIIKIIEKIEKDVEDGKILNKSFEEIYDDGNYTQFDINIDEINIKLSFWKWISGKGFIYEAKIKGIRGIIDRTHVVWKEGDDPRNYKNFYKPGDWEIENFKIEDLLVTIYHPNGFRPCKLSIYNGDFDLFRKNWLMLDLITCNHLSGCYDGSLFTINKITKFDNFKEEIKIDLLVNKKLGREKFHKITNDSDNLNKITRFRIDNLKIEHLNKGMEGPFGWINKGTVDIITDIIVIEKNNLTLNEILKTEGFSQLLNNNSSNNSNSNSNSNNDSDKNLFICDFYLRLKNPKAQVPLFTNDLSYINNAAIRPIVGYINNNKTFIPIRCRVVKDLKDWDGSWTFYDSLFMDDLSEGVYQSFYEYAVDEGLRNERLRKVGFWSVQFLLQFVLWSLATING